MWVDGPGERASWSALLSAVRGGFYDGVVVHSLAVVVEGVLQALGVQQCLFAASCDLYVFDAPAASLWGAGAAVFMRFAWEAEGRAEGGGLSGCAGDGGTGGVGDRRLGGGDEFAVRERVLLARLVAVEDLLLDGTLSGRALADVRWRHRRLLQRLRIVKLERLRGALS